MKHKFTVYQKDWMFDLFDENNKIVWEFPGNTNLIHLEPVHNPCRRDDDNYRDHDGFLKPQKRSIDRKCVRCQLEIPEGSYNLWKTLKNLKMII